MDNGIEIPVNDMSGQGNSQKLANDLNLALDMGYERVAADSGLYTGYDSGSNTWELIVKYTGDIQSVAKRYGASAVVLLGGYAIVTLPQEHINEFADCAEVVYIEKPHRLFFSAETVLGKALTELQRESFLLSTKVGRYGAGGVNTWDYSAGRTRESVFESMERLHVDYIDLINVHDIEFADLSQVVDETLPALVELREKGLVGHVGITDLQLENLKWVIDHVPEGTVESVLNFCHYTLNDDKLVDFLDYFEEKGVGVINASPFAMGLLSQRGVPEWHPAPAALVEACRKASDYCLSQGYPIEKLAIQYSVSNPRIGTTLFSSANPDNVLKNIQYIEEPIDWDLVAKVKEIIGDQQRVTWKNT